ADVWWLLRTSGWFEVRFPEVQVQHLVRLRRLPPQFTPVEAHAVQWSRVRSLAVGVTVREGLHPVHVVYDAPLSARVAGQPRVALRVHVAHHDRVTDAEARRNVGGI